MAKKINRATEEITDVEDGNRSDNFFEIVQDACDIFKIDFLNLLEKYFNTSDKERKIDINSKLNQLILTATIFGITFRSTKEMDSIFAKCLDLSEKIKYESDVAIKTKLQTELEPLTRKYLNLFKEQNYDYLKFINKNNMFSK